jgi:hypothetical protein
MRISRVLCARAVICPAFRAIVRFLAGIGHISGPQGAAAIQIYRVLRRASLIEEFRIPEMNSLYDRRQHPQMRIGNLAVGMARMFHLDGADASIRRSNCKLPATTSFASTIFSVTVSTNAIVIALEYPQARSCSNGVVASQPRSSTISVKIGPLLASKPSEPCSEIHDRVLYRVDQPRIIQPGHQRSSPTFAPRRFVQGPVGGFHPPIPCRGSEAK